MEWHIDAWDARGGRAFATQRSRNSDIGQPDGEEWGPTVFIGPPSFRPEQIANIGIALSARRAGSFDRRVPLNENLEEIQFNTPDAVADFVRRAFTNSIRNRGDDGGGAIGFEGGPEGPPPIDGEESVAAQTFLGEWSNEVQHLEKSPPGVLAAYLGNQLPYTFAAPAASAKAGQIGPVESGALQVLATVLDAVPMYGLSSPMFAQWQDAATTLDAALSELGLWHAWHTAPDPAHRQINDYLRFRATKLVKPELQEVINGISFAQTLLRWQPTTGNPDDAAEYFWRTLHHSQRYADDNQSLVRAPMTERYDALFTWPLPRYVNVDSVRSVGDLLAAFVSSPSLFMKKGPAPRHAIDIVTFAACVLASRMESRSTDGWRERAAATWLAGSVPRWIFRSDIEALILDPEHAPALAGASR